MRPPGGTPCRIEVNGRCPAWQRALDGPPAERAIPRRSLLNGDGSRASPVPAVPRGDGSTEHCEANAGPTGTRAVHNSVTPSGPSAVAGGRCASWPAGRTRLRQRDRLPCDGSQRHRGHPIRGPPESGWRGSPRLPLAGPYLLGDLPLIGVPIDLLRPPVPDLQLDFPLARCNGRGRRPHERVHALMARFRNAWLAASVPVCGVHSQDERALVTWPWAQGDRIRRILAT